MMKDFLNIISIIIMGMLLIILVYTMCSCTISFQNISTHGTATDVVDEDLNTSPDIKTELTIPAKVI